ncbi:MAG: hypothetical protein ACK4UO_07355 [Pseudolabrys sp.]
MNIPQGERSRGSFNTASEPDAAAGTLAGAEICGAGAACVGDAGAVATGSAVGCGAGVAGAVAAGGVACGVVCGVWARTEMGSIKPTATSAASRRRWATQESLLILSISSIVPYFWPRA